MTGDVYAVLQGSFRGHLSTSPQQSATKRRPNESAVAHFFRSFVSAVALGPSPFSYICSKCVRKTGRDREDLMRRYCGIDVTQHGLLWAAI